MFYDQPSSASRVGGGFPQLLGDSHARPYFPPGCPAIRGKATANPGSSFFSLCAVPKAGGVHGRPESADRTPLLKMVRRSSRLDSGAWEIGNIHVCEWSMDWNKKSYSWTHLRPSWGYVGPSWAPCWPILEAPLAPFWAMLSKTSKAPPKKTHTVNHGPIGGRRQRHPGAPTISFGDGDALWAWTRPGSLAGLSVLTKGRARPQPSKTGDTEIHEKCIKMRTPFFNENS